MDIVTILVGIISVLGALALKLAATELQEWLPTLARSLIKRTVERLPLDQRERYREELSAHLDEFPGKLAQLDAY